MRAFIWPRLQVDLNYILRQGDYQVGIITTLVYVKADVVLSGSTPCGFILLN